LAATVAVLRGAPKAHLNFLFCFQKRRVHAVAALSSSTRCLEGNGMGGLADAGVWGAAWAVFAVAAGSGLAVAAIAPFRRSAAEEPVEFDVGYNMLAPMLDTLKFPAKI
jgi:hypothetical protein